VLELKPIYREDKVLKELKPEDLMFFDQIL